MTTSYLVGKEDLLDWTKRILQDYSGVPVTKRQLYYRLVANGVIPNTIPSYKRVINMTTDWILDGVLSIHAFEDRSRSLIEYDTGWRDHDPKSWLKFALEEAIQIAEQYSLARWFGQDKRVIVAVEKQALQGVFDQICKEYNVDLAVFKGYSSLSFLDEISQSIDGDENDGRDVVVLYFGDFDPSGKDIPRSAEEHLNGFFQQNVVFKRIALERDEAESMSLIPAPVKTTDSRSNKFIQDNGTNVYELDAIEPKTLQRMIRKAIEEYIEHNHLEERERLMQDGRKLIKEKLEHSGIKNLIQSLGSGA